MARSQRDLVRERRWREHVAGWQTSGLSIREFCSQHGLIETSFHYWKRELKSRDAASNTRTLPKFSATSSRSSAVPTFVPVTVIPAATLAVEVRCPSGHVVIVSACEVSSLASLFAALNSPGNGESSC